MVLAVLALAFGAVLRTSVNHNLHLPFVPRILIQKFLGYFSNYSCMKNLKCNAVLKDFSFKETWLKNWSDGVFCDVRAAEFLC